METQLFAKLKDGRLLPVKDVDNQAVSLRVKPGVILTIAMKEIKAFQCFKGRGLKE